jgi:hypothetical protein
MIERSAWRQTERKQEGRGMNRVKDIDKRLRDRYTSGGRNRMRKVVKRKTDRNISWICRYTNLEPGRQIIQAGR